MSSEIKQTMIVLSGSGGIMTCDTIFHEGKFWLVPEWLENHTESYRFPKRLISLDSFEYQKQGGHSYSFVINKPIPIEIYNGQTEELKGKKYSVLSCPDIRFPLKNTMH